MESAKRLTDLRGPQRRIGRLAFFHFEAYIHMVFYRILVPLSILYGAFLVVFLLVPGLGTWLKIFTAAVWILWTPQFNEVAKGLALARSRGMVFGRLNGEFAALYGKRYPKRKGLLTAFPYVVAALWAAGFALLIAGWHP